MQVIIFFLILSAFVGPYAFIILPQLHLIRFLTPLFILLHINTPFKPTYPIKLTLIYFGIYLIYTLTISLFYFQNIELHDVANFILLHGFILSIIIAALVYPDRFFNSLVLALICFIVVSLMIALYEEINLAHLSYSSMSIEPKKWPERHMPTTFFTNPNDFAAIYLMSTMFLLTVFSNKTPGKLRLLIPIFLIPACAWIISVTDSKINLIAFCIFLVFYFRLWRLKRMLQIGFLLFIFFLTFFEPIYNYLTRQKTQLLTFQVVSGGSISERWLMIKYGIKSIFDGYGFGFGVNSSNDYYRQFIGKGLSGYVTDPHNYIIEILINSGVWVLIIYLSLNVLILRHFIRNRVSRLIVVQFALYNFILISSSTSLFLWPHYLFFISYISFNNEAIYRQHLL